MPRHITLQVTASQAGGPGVRRLTLRDPDGYMLPRVQAGAYLDLVGPGIGMRAYSLCGDQAIADRWEIAVKREEASRGGSAWLHDELKVGDAMASSMPRCNFSIADEALRHVMIAGGIGVTPFLAMAPVLERATDRWVLHVLHRGEPPPCADDLAPWIAAGRAILHDTLTAPRPPLSSLLGSFASGTVAYCCGPRPMLDAFEGVTADWPEGTARVERFVPPVLPPDPDARPYTLVRARTGASTEVPAGGSMLAALREMGAQVESSCEGGICGACEVRWLEGAPVHRDRLLSPARRATHLISCVANCASSRLVVDL
jgi:ferredoxin-NADP reductase